MKYFTIIVWREATYGTQQPELLGLWFTREDAEAWGQSDTGKGVLGNCAWGVLQLKATEP